MPIFFCLFFSLNVCINLSPYLLHTLAVPHSLSLYLSLTLYIFLSLQVRTRLMNQPSDARLYSGAIDCFVQIIKKDGFKGLYAGKYTCVYALSVRPVPVALCTPLVVFLVRTCCLYSAYLYVLLVFYCTVYYLLGVVENGEVHDSVFFIKIIYCFSVLCLSVWLTDWCIRGRE